MPTKRPPAWQNPELVQYWIIDHHMRCGHCGTGWITRASEYADVYECPLCGRPRGRPVDPTAANGAPTGAHQAEKE